MLLQRCLADRKLTTLLRPINELKSAFENSGVAQSMRFVAGVTDQISARIAQLEVATLDAVQSCATQADTTLLSDTLSSIQQQMVAIATSTAALGENSTANVVESSLSALATDIRDLKAGAERLASVEKRLADIQRGGEDAAAALSVHSEMLQDLTGITKALEKNSSALPLMEEQVLSIAATMNDRNDAAALTQLARDLVDLKNNTALLGRISTQVERLASGVDRVQTQHDQIGQQLHRLDAVEEGVQSIKDRSGVLCDIDKAFADMKAGLDNDRQASDRGNLEVLRRVSELLQTRAQMVDAALPRALQGVQHVVPSPSNASNNASTAPRPARLAELDTVITGSSMGTSPTTLARTAATENASAHSPPHRSSTHNGPSAGNSHENGVTSLQDASASTGSALHLLSLVASRASPDGRQSQSLLPWTASIAHASPSSTTLDGNASDTVLPTLAHSTSASAASESSSNGPKTPDSMMQHPAEARHNLSLSTPAASALSENSAPTSATASVPRPRKRRHKWKEARQGERRSSRIQARAESHNAEQRQRVEESLEPSGQPREQRAEHAQETATPDTDARLALSAWSSERKRKPQTEPELRQAKRATNNSLSIIFGAVNGTT